MQIRANNRTFFLTWTNEGRFTVNGNNTRSFETAREAMEWYLGETVTSYEVIG